MKFNGTHQLLVYAVDVNILGGSIYVIRKDTEALVVVSKETGLLVNADKTKYMVMSRIRRMRWAGHVARMGWRGEVHTGF